MAPRLTAEMRRSPDCSVMNPVSTYVPGWKQNVVALEYEFKTLCTSAPGDNDTPEHAAGVVVVVGGATVVLVVLGVDVVVAESGTVDVVVGSAIVVVVSAIVVVVSAIVVVDDSGSVVLVVDESVVLA